MKRKDHAKRNGEEKGNIGMELREQSKRNGGKRRNTWEGGGRNKDEWRKNENLEEWGENIEEGMEGKDQEREIKRKQRNMEKR